MPTEKSFFNSNEVHRRCQNDSHILGWNDAKTYWRLLERGWRNKIIRCMDWLHKIYVYWTKGHLTDIHGLERDWRGNKQPQDPTMYGQVCGKTCLMQQKAKRSKSGLSRNQRSIMPDKYVVSSSLNQMKNSNTPWKTLVESWKFRCQHQCLV